jgi:dTDP-4-dehydrorhamnose reductase
MQLPVKDKTITVAVTGLSGVIGSMLCDALPEHVRVVDLFHTSPVTCGDTHIVRHAYIDLLRPDQIRATLAEVVPDVVIHLAAVTHIDTCEMDKANGKDGIVWRTNVEGTKVIARYCRDLSIPIIYLSTECVFDGKLPLYDEQAGKNPINWYGKTKSEAENSIVEIGCESAIVRAVVAYHPNDGGKTIFGRMYNQLKYNKTLMAVHDQLFTPTYTGDIVDAIVRIIEHRTTGIFHVSPKHILTPYDFAMLIAERFKFNTEQVHKTTLSALYGPVNATLRLRHACLSGDATNRTLGISPQTPQQVFQKIASNRIDLPFEIT